MPASTSAAYGQPSRPPPTEESRGTDYAALTRRIRHAGLFERRPGHYAARFAITLALFAGGGVAFFLLGDSWLQIILAAGLALVFTQVAFLAHDVGHQQVFASKRRARLVGLLLGNLGIGLSFGWWNGKHTRHHANPNHVDVDPDIRVGGIVWTTDQARKRHGTIARTLGGWQAFLFFPMLTLEGLDLYVTGVRALLRHDVKRRGVELFLLAVHTIGCMSALFLVLSPGKALVFLAVQQGVFGFYLGCSFAPNHKGMPLLESRLDYLRKQILTARDVRGGWFVDHALGGLNYQIEHHLFPSMPMANLRRAKPLVEAFCREHGIAYYDTGLFRSYREILAYLHDTGASLRVPRRSTS